MGRSTLDSHATNIHTPPIKKPASGRRIADFESVLSARRGTEAGRPMNLVPGVGLEPTLYFYK